MEKLKHVLSHGHEKKGETLTGEGSHLASAKGEIPHPIYDQFTGKAQEERSANPLLTTVQPSHSSRIPVSTQSGDHGAKSGGGLQATENVPHFSDTKHTPAGNDYVPKSGRDVKPTGELSHLSSASDAKTTLPQRTRDIGDFSTSETTQGALLDATPTLSQKTRNIGDSSTGNTTQGALLVPRPGHLSQGSVGTDEISNASIKSGVTGMPKGTSSAEQQYSSKPEQSSYLDKTKHALETGASNAGYGAGLVAGTVTGAVAGAFSGLKGNKKTDHTTTKEPELVTDSNREFPLAGGVTSRKDVTNPSPSHAAGDLVHSDPPNTTSSYDIREDLTGADTAASPEPKYGQYAEAPHPYDGTNTSYHIPGEYRKPTPSEIPPPPKIYHIPGEFPDPTPTGEKSEPQYEHGVEDISDSHSKLPADHHSRDTAVTGGAGFGALGLGAYQAGHHPSKESAEIGDNQISTAPNPYSSSLDPRVGAKEQASLKDRGVDASSPPVPVSDNKGRDTSLIGGVVGSGGYEATKHDHHGHSDRAHHHDHHEKAQPETIQPTLENKDSKSDPANRHGRNVAFAGTGAAAAGGLYAASQEKEKPDSIGLNTVSQENEKGDTGPASKTIGPHKSNVANILDPRVQPEPENMKERSTTGPHKSDTLNKLDPKVDSKAESNDHHHYGRDAAVAGGAGAAGYGLYDTAKSYGDHSITQPSANLQEQRYDPSAKGVQDSYPSAQHQGSGQTSTAMDAQRYDTSAKGAHDPNQPAHHHYGRDAAVAGGAGATGYGAYKASKSGEDSSYNAPKSYENQQPAQTVQGSQGRDATGVGAVGTTGYSPSQGSNAGDNSPNIQKPYENQQHSQKPSQDDQHHYGRDAAFSGGVGAAGYGAYKATHGKDDDAQKIPKSYENQQPLQQQQYQQIHQAHTVSREPPAYPAQAIYQSEPAQQSQSGQPSQHNYGRDAAVAGGVGAVGYGTYQAVQPGDDDTQRTSKFQEGQQPVQKTTHTDQSTQQTRPSQHHYGHDAAIAGGAGAVGYGAYKAGDDHKEAPKPFDSSVPETQYPSQQKSATHQRYDSAIDPQDPKNQTHDKRNAAAAGAVGVAGAGAAYEYSQHDDEKAEKERLKELEKQQKQQQKDLEKQHKHDEKEAKKEQKHEQKAAEKEAKKEEKQHEKDLKKEQKHEEREERRHAAQVAAFEEDQRQREAEAQKKHAAEVAALEQKQQKELEREEQEKEKKRHHLLPFLHRDKKDKKSVDDTPDSEQVGQTQPLQSTENEYATGAAITTPYEAQPKTEPFARENDYTNPNAGNETHSYGKTKESRHKLHKDPPPGHPAREAMEGKYEQLGAEGNDPIALVKGDDKIHSGVYGVHGN